MIEAQGENDMNDIVTIIVNELFNTDLSIELIVHHMNTLALGH